ncbi:MAG: TetR/AcrR family transcriptional regulator [Chloroflexota bacterium]
MLQNSSKTDLRVRRTRKLLRDALVELLNENDLETITVGDITERAMVNRSTFYRHFHDKADLLVHGMDDVLATLKAQLAPPVSVDGTVNHAAPLTNLHLMLTHVKAHAAFYRTMLGQTVPGTFDNHLRDHLRKVAAGRWRALEEQGLIQATMPIDLILDFYASAYVGAVSWWVHQGCPGTVEQMVQNLMQLTASASYSTLGVQSVKDTAD